MKINCYINKSNALRIAEHLGGCDEEFVPPLSSRVNIDEYALKIFDKAIRFESIEQGKIVGLVAIYCNDEKKTLAYITSVSVNKDRQGMGIGSQLLDAGIEYVKSLDFKTIELEVANTNTEAINLYEKKRFLLHENKPDVIVLRLEI